MTLLRNHMKTLRNIRFADLLKMVGGTMVSYMIFLIYVLMFGI